MTSKYGGSNWVIITAETDPITQPHPSGTVSGMFLLFALASLLLCMRWFYKVFLFLFHSDHQATRRPMWARLSLQCTAQSSARPPSAALKICSWASRTPANSRPSWLNGLTRQSWLEVSRTHLSKRNLELVMSSRWGKTCVVNAL